MSKVDYRLFAWRNTSGFDGWFFSACNPEGYRLTRLQKVRRIVAYNWIMTRNAWAWKVRVEIAWAWLIMTGNVPRRRCDRCWE